MSKEIFDITIIGGGPVGLYAAFYAGLRQAKVKIIESLEQLGGQPGMLYPEKVIYDIPAFPEITAGQLVENLITQLKRFPDTTICLGEEAFQLTKEDGVFEIITPKAKHYSKAVIVACGNGAFRPRKLEIENADLYEGNNLHYFVNNIERFKDRVVAICGGGDSAVDWALTLEPIAKKVMVIHRRPQFRAQEHSVELMKQSSIEILTPYVPVRVSGDVETLQSVTIKQSRGEEELEIAVDDFLVNYGFSSSIGALKSWGLDISRNTIPVSSTMETSVEGIYAIGDIATYEGKVKVIASGFGEAPTAVNNAMAYINPDQRVQPMHSTSLF